jgi:hypothetical protein
MTRAILVAVAVSEPLDNLIAPHSLLCIVTCVHGRVRGNSTGSNQLRHHSMVTTASIGTSNVDIFFSQTMHDI